VVVIVEPDRDQLARTRDRSQQSRIRGADRRRIGRCRIDRTPERRERGLATRQQLLDGRRHAIRELARDQDAAVRPLHAQPRLSALRDGDESHDPP
jgi:hypothetical protein